ncbi:hypothetical protein BDZ45DRAFT_755683 [Acephala macrosclerotiorum]|nr:hypothetical protein BDZ45DRAFT_755683 [Acephala macrosclerotiorum]
MYKKRKHRRSTRQNGPRSKPHRRSLKSHSPLDQGSRVAAVSGAEGGLRDALIEVTVHPHSTRYCSFVAMVWVIATDEEFLSASLVNLSRVLAKRGRLTTSISSRYSFLLTGFSRHTLSRFSSNGTTILTAAEANRVHDDATRSQLWYSKAVNTVGAIAPRGSELFSSDHEAGLSHSGLNSSSNDGVCSSRDEQGRSSTSKHSRWDGIDEQRLLAYKKEDKSWGWIFKKFLGRTPAAVDRRQLKLLSFGKCCDECIYHPIVAEV